MTDWLWVVIPLIFVVLDCIWKSRTQARIKHLEETLAELVQQHQHSFR